MHLSAIKKMDPDDSYVSRFIEYASGYIFQENRQPMYTNPSQNVVLD